MTADNTDETQVPLTRQSRGVWAVGCDLRVSGLSFALGLNGEPDPNAGHATVELRTDMWRFWLEDAINAAQAAVSVADQIPPTLEQYEAGNATTEDLEQLVTRELIAAMRAMTACAFAIDAFYASVKARSPKHPQQDIWNAKGTARHKQVAETFRFHLKIKDREAVKEIKSRVSQLFRFRNWAVHPGAQFRPPIYRPDLNAALDWHFTVFCRENAVKATAMTVQMMDSFVTVLDRGSAELAEQKQGARRVMDAILDRYESANCLSELQRVESPATS
ncbi:hypothetical protein [Mycolicibacterium setense]|uniref:hypothetical protein n=1 Tax=Mycolicibacterium setense TaxID=431269 RepID=UPI00103F378C|nr:hypothetical protein [Mycolicibacterium setense]